MGLFTRDMYRSLALGFAAGALLVFGVMGIDGIGSLSSDIVPAASAAPAP